MYIMIGCVGYYRLGSDFDKSKPVTSVLPQDIWTSLANVGLLAHCIVAYMVCSAAAILRILMPQSREVSARSITMTHACIWHCSWCIRGLARCRVQMRVHGKGTEC